MHEKLWNEAVAAGLKKDTVMAALWTHNQVINIHANKYSGAQQHTFNNNLVGPLLCDDSVNGHKHWAHRHTAIHRGIGE